MSDVESRKLWRIRRAIFKMLKDRGYLVDDRQLQEPFDDFEMLFRSAEVQGQRERMIIYAQKASLAGDATDWIVVFFGEEKGKTGVRPVRALVDLMQKPLDARIPKMTRGVMVVENPLTAFSRRAIAELTGMRIDTFLDNELLVNITDHILVPKHELLTVSEKAAVLTRYSIKENQLPRIMASDPVARYLGLKKGDVVKITRKSATAGRYVTYRVCDTAM
mmetsp:Transcript_59081/g.136297  ORF Transcript_59081/g.136297 Transcript_59081/m.136297 type:complete len:220 (-) Transcript_59081:87-746(-)